MKYNEKSASLFPERNYDRKTKQIIENPEL